MLCVSSTNNITLNINKLDLLNATVKFGSVNDSTETPHFENYEIDTKWQFLTIHLDGSLRPSVEYFLEMNFTGPLKSDYAGFYLSTFRLKDANR